MNEPGKPTREAMFLDQLSLFADVFLVALQDRRCAKSSRPSSEGKRIQFLAVAMAGASRGLLPRSANDLVTKKPKRQDSARGKKEKAVEGFPGFLN